MNHNRLLAMLMQYRPSCKLIVRRKDHADVETTIMEFAMKLPPTITVDGPVYDLTYMGYPSVIVRERHADFGSRRTAAQAEFPFKPPYAGEWVEVEFWE